MSHRTEHALGFGNILEGQASIREKLCADGVGAEEKTDKAGIGSCRLRPIVDDDPQLLAGAFEASWDGQSCHLAIDLGLGLVNRLAFARFVQAAQDLVLIQRIPRSPHNPKILWVDDAEIVGDRFAEVSPVPGNCFT